MRQKLSFKERLFSYIIHLFLLLFGFITLYPFIYIFALSLNDGNDAMRGGIYFLPRVFTLDNYIKAFQDPLIFGAYQITLFRTILGTLISVFFTALLAFGLMKKGMPGRTVLIFYFFFTTLFGGGLIPTFILFRQLHLTTSVWIYILPYVYSFFYMIIMRTYFESIPESIYEAAVIDGCNEIRIFFQIYLQLSGPVLATLTLFFGVFQWNDYTTGTFFVGNRALWPSATLLQQILTEINIQESASQDIRNVNTALMQSGSSVTSESLRMAFVMIMTIPIVCIYPFIQKYFVKGVMVGSVKG